MAMGLEIYKFGNCDFVLQASQKKTIIKKMDCVRFDDGIIQSSFKGTSFIVFITGVLVGMDQAFKIVPPYTMCTLCST